MQTFSQTLSRKFPNNLLSNYNTMNKNKNKEIKPLWLDFLNEKASTIQSIQSKAAEIHASVNQNYGALPYSFHTNMVSNTFMQFAAVCFSTCAYPEHAIQSDGLAAIFAAAFHDTIEDCRLTYNDVKSIASKYMGKMQSELAADIVYALTNEKGKTREERANDKYYEGILNTPFAPLIKLCDRYVNAMYSNALGSNMAKTYSNEMNSFIAKITCNESDTNSSHFLSSELVDMCMAFPLVH